MITFRKPLKIVIGILLILSLCTPAFASKAQSSKPKYIMVSCVSTADPDISGNTIAVVTSDNRFAQIKIQPSTKITKSGKPVKLVEITSGYKLNCKGNWDENSFPLTFTAEYVFLDAKLSDIEVRERVSAACRNISNASNQQKKQIPTSASTKTNKEENLPPQISIIDHEWHYGGNGGYSTFACKVKNISKEKLFGLSAIVDFYDKDSKYLVSSAENPGKASNMDYGPVPVEPEKIDIFIIDTFFTPDEFPGIAKCKLKIYAHNKSGELRINPSDDVFFEGTSE